MVRKPDKDDVVVLGTDVPRYLQKTRMNSRLGIVGKSVRLKWTDAIQSITWVVCGYMHKSSYSSSVMGTIREKKKNTIEMEKIEIYLKFTVHVNSSGHLLVTNSPSNL